MLIIGSRAAELNGIKLERALSTDFDVILSRKKAMEMGLDTSSFHGNNSVYDYWIKDDTPLEMLESSGYIDYASPSELYALKRAHRYIWRGDVEFSHKALWDCCVLSQYADMDDEILDGEFTAKWSKFLSKENKSRPARKINKGKEDFFSDKVDYHYDHDSIHEVMAHFDKPLYTRHLKGDVLMDNSSFINSPHDEKLLQVLEESYVIALERIVIPNLLKNSYKDGLEHKAFKWALCRVCTNLCGGPFRDFAADNYKHLITNYNKKYLSVFIENSSKLVRYKNA